MFKVGSFAIIFNQDNGVLLCHRRDYDLWNLPGGGVEKGESPWDAVAREVKEEINLDVEIKRLVGVYSKPEKNEIVFSFLCNIVGGKMALSDEVDRVKYFTIDDIPKNTSPKHIERIKDLVNSKELVLKEQFGQSSIELVKQGKL